MTILEIIRIGLLAYCDVGAWKGSAVTVDQKVCVEQFMNCAVKDPDKDRIDILVDCAQLVKKEKK